MSFAEENPALERREYEWWIAVRERLFAGVPVDASADTTAALEIKKIVENFILMRRVTRTSGAPSTKERNAESAAKTLRKAADVLRRVPEAAWALESWPYAKEVDQPRARPDQAPKPILPPGRAAVSRIARILDMISEYILSGRQGNEWLDFNFILQLASDKAPIARLRPIDSFVYRLTGVFIQTRDSQLSEVNIGDHTTETGLVGFLAAVSRHPDIPQGSRNGLSPQSLRRSAATLKQYAAARSNASEKSSR